MKTHADWFRHLARLLALTLFWAPFPAIAEDIDIFTGGSIAASNPSILFVFDNTSNWARQSQQWPGGEQQGQSEVDALKSLINSPLITSGINIGVMEFVTEGTANNNGGFVRFPVLPMSDANKATLSSKLTTMYNDINGVDEKRNSNEPYGNLLYDVYNYLTSGAPYDSLDPPNPDAATAAYTTPYTQFKSPITADNGCGRVFMVFVSNPNASGPASDSATNKTTLGGLGCSTEDIPLKNFTTRTEQRSVSLGEDVYASQAACETAAAAAHGSNYESYTCSAKTTSSVSTTLTTTSCGDYASTDACKAAAATTYGAAYSSYSCEVASSCTGITALGTSTCGQYADAASCITGTAAAFPDYASHSCTPSASLCSGSSSTLGTTTCGQYKTQAACESAAPATWPGYSTYACSSSGGGAGACTSTDLDAAACYASSATCQSTVLAANLGYNSVSCSSAVACNQTVTTCAAANAYNTSDKCNTGAPLLLPAGTYTSYSCSAGANCGGGKTWTITGITGTSSYQALGNGTKWQVSGTTGTSGTRFDMTGSGPASTHRIIGHADTVTYEIFGNYTATVSEQTETVSDASNMYMADEWARCLRGTDLSPDGTAGEREQFSANFTASGAIVGADTITFNGVTTTLEGGETPAQIAQKVARAEYPDWYASNNGTDAIVNFTKKNSGVNANTVPGDFSIVDVGATGTLPVVSVVTTVEGTNGTGGAVGNQNVTTYTIDVYNAQQNATHTSLMLSMADKGGGKYFAARSKDEILGAFQKIVSDIQSVNTAFAAASIPLSTTNRSQNLNEVYIGVFRPSLEPRWFGNLKKFKIATSGGVTDLVDSTGTTSALNTQTGFLNDCATSFWTTDSGNWWENVTIGGATLSETPLLSPVPSSKCVAMPAANTSKYSDLPDGQSVEKGSVAEVIRKGNNPPDTQDTPTWAVNRNIFTRGLAGSALPSLTSGNLATADLYNYVRGVDINVSGSHVTEKPLATAIADAVRASVHGDVVHSRPLAINYSSTNTTIYYGANDGMLRAVDGATGKERWAFIPPEFLGTTLQTRLMQNKPPIAYGSSPVSGSQPKTYTFDGSPGIWQNRDNTQVWLFPTQRRGGRMLHGLDVTTDKTAAPAPVLKWFNGCPNLGSDSDCTTGFSDIGQTWSVPVITRIKGYSMTRPVVIVGGGYDNCEDVKPTSNPPTWDCGSAKGRAIFVIDAEDGSLVKKFTIAGMRGVTGGVAVIDVNNDGFSDYGYAADLGGAIYRLSFIDGPSTAASLAAGTGSTGDNLATTDEWKIKKVAYATNGRKFMFTPAITFGGVTGGVYSVYVALGSGDRERPLISDYPYTMNVLNRVYAYRDDLNFYTDPVTACNLDDSTDADGDGVLDGCVLDYTSTPATCESPGIPPGDSKKAWRVSMVHQGEQTVTQALIVSGLVTLNTTRPMPAGNCSAALGEGGGYFLNLVNGSGAVGVSGACGGDKRGYFTGVGLPTDPVLVNLPGQDPICIGCVSRTSEDTGSQLFAPGKIPLTISKTKFRKYRYQVVD